MLVTHTDGYKLDSPYYKDTILIGPGERYDAYVTLDNPGPWMLHDHISLNEQNDYIAPGGMALMLCYTDGWKFAEKCKDGEHIIMGGGTFTSGDVLAGQVAALGGVLPRPEATLPTTTAGGKFHTHQPTGGSERAGESDASEGGLASALPPLQ
jgi:multicopper oxidase